MNPRIVVFQSAEVKLMRIKLQRLQHMNANRVCASKWSPRTDDLALILKIEDLVDSANKSKES